MFVFEVLSMKTLSIGAASVVFISFHMQEELQSAESFFKVDVPKALDQLQADITPQWGLMTAQHMVEHLIVTYKMSIGRIKIPAVVKPEEMERNKTYLMKDSPMRRSVPSPTGKNELQALRFDSLADAIKKLKEEVIKFDEFREQNPEFLAVHPYSGPMNPAEWLLFHRKHFKHHLIQFDLIPDYA